MKYLILMGISRLSIICIIGNLLVPNTYLYAQNTWTHIADNQNTQRSMEFLDSLHGVVITSTNISRTEDGGYTWINVSDSLGTTWGGHDVSFDAQGNGMAVRNNSASVPTTDYYISYDSGKSWSNPSHIFNEYVSIVQVEANNKAYVMTFSGVKPGEVYSTADLGDNWAVNFKSGSNTRFLDMDFINDSTGFIIALKDDTIPFVSYTHSSGNSWDSVPAPVLLQSDIKVRAQNDTSLLLYSGFSSLVFHTTNLGQTWDTLFYSDSLRIAFVKYFYPDSLYIFANNININKTEIYFSSDSGKSFIKQTLEGFETYSITDISFISSNKAWLCGNGSEISALHLSPKVGIEKPADKRVFNIYPNPAQVGEGIHISMAAQRQALVKIRTLQGQLVQQSNSLSFTLADLAPGVYLVDVLGEEGKVAYKSRSLVVR